MYTYMFVCACAGVVVRTHTRVNPYIHEIYIYTYVFVCAAVGVRTHAFVKGAAAAEKGRRDRCMYVCKDSAALGLANVHARAQRGRHS